MAKINNLNNHLTKTIFPELLAPVGNKSMLVAAVKAGADAIYFGIKGLNMRAASGNFSLDDLSDIVKYCHKNKVKAYCTLNVIVFESELKRLKEALIELKKAKIDAVICWDLAVIKICKELGITVHLSTQASVSNSESAKFWKELGVKRIVLARECSLEDIKEIKEKADIEIECFVHGARCISLSGRCFMSHELFNKSANRGECLQPCRREWKVTDEEGKEMIMNHNFIMSAKDLCALPLLPKLIDLKINSLKIEGRNRGAEYVHKVVSGYRKALDAVKNKIFSEKLAAELVEELNKTYNKGFSQGFFVDYPYHQRCDVYGSKAAEEKIQVGKVKNFYKRNKVVEFRIDSGDFSRGDKLAFIGDTTGYIEQIVTDIHSDSGKISTAKKGEIVTLKITNIVRENDKVFLIKNRNFKKEASHKNN